MSGVIVAVLLALVALRWGILLGAAAVLVPRLRRCPACFGDTVPVRRPWLRRIAPWLQWRWCAGCGWEGPSRREENHLVPDPSARGPLPRVRSRQRRRPGPER